MFKYFFWTFLVAMLAMGVGSMMCGCAPMSVKQSAVMTGEVLGKIREVAAAPILPEEDLAPRLVAIEAMAGDGMALNEAVQVYMGDPETIVQYTADNAAALATRAQADAALRVAIRDAMKDLIPKPVAAGFKWLESIAALIAAYGGTKISVAGINAARKKLKKG